MTLLYTKVFLNTLVFFVYTVLTESFEGKSFRRFENIFDFTVGLRYESEDMLDYATKIQALVCPEQPICSVEAERNRTDVLNTLPEILGIGTETIRIEDVQNLITACCMPCSCDTKSCHENNNCCLSKIGAHALQNSPDMDDQNAIGVPEILQGASTLKDKNVTAVYSECIQASWISYQDKNAFELVTDLDIPGYFMITRCFENSTSPEDVIKCQTPLEYAEEVMLPVTSSVTGRIYWNSYCARCNNDGMDVLPWIASVKFDTDIAYFINYSYPSLAVFPDTYDDIPDFISKTGNIVYRPPFPQKDKLCLRKTNLRTCKRPRTKPIGSWLEKNSTGSWLEKTCERIYSPLIIEGALERRYAFLNIFCYLCRQQYIKPNANRKCDYAERQEKNMFVRLSALLDFIASNSSTNAVSIVPRQGKCRCDEIFDLNLVSIYSL